MATTISADEALLWLRAYHAETVALARSIANAGYEMASAAHDIHAVPEADRPVQRARYQTAATEFQRLRQAINER